MKWFKIDFNDVFLNGLTTAEVGCVIKYKCMCQQLGVDELDDARIKSLFSSREQKFVRNYFKVCSKNTEVCSNLSEVCSKNAKVCSKKEPKNNDVADIYNIYNNIEKTDKTERKDKTIQESSDKSPYVFSGKVIHLNKKDFDEWSEMFPDLNLRAELMVRDKYLAEQSEKERKNWFISTSQYFIKQNERRKAQNRGFDDEEQEDMEDWLRRSVR